MSRSPGLKIKLAELTRRITGFSLPPGFGVQWNPPKSERDTVRALLTFLEDRRVLYDPFHLEVRDQVERSVLEIRQQCTETLAALPEGSPAIGAVRAIRGTCRRFLSSPFTDFRNLYTRDYGSFREEAGFFTALGECRALIGAQIALLAVRYEIELEADLASILPFGDQEDGE